MYKKIVIVFILGLLIGTTVLSVVGKINTSYMSPILNYSPESNNFGVLLEGDVVQTQFKIWNTGWLMTGETMEWHLAIVDPGLTLNPMQGECTFERDFITVTLDTSGYDVGNYYDFIISIYSDGGNGYFHVLFSITDGPEILEFSPITYYEYDEEGQEHIGENEEFQITFDIWNGGTGTLNWNLAIVDPEIWLTPWQGQSSGENDYVTVTVTIDTAGLTPGEYQFNVGIVSNGGDSFFRIFLEIIKNTNLELSGPQYGQRILEKHTCDGLDVSPLLNIKNAPIGTERYVLFMYDEDAIPIAEIVWDHWIVINIDKSVVVLNEDEGAPDSSLVHGMNSWGNNYYQGPCPPHSELHHYYFKLFALNQAVSLSKGASKLQILEDMNNHVIGVSRLMCLYSRSVNNPPNRPTIPSGQMVGETGNIYLYESYFSDPDGDSMEILFDWGDGTDTDWIGVIASGVTIGNYHTWNTDGIYQVRTKARDLPLYEESEWSDSLVVVMPKNKAIDISLFLQKFFQRFPILNEILNQIL